MLFGTEKHPKGPSFKSAQLRIKNLSGTRLSFKTPKPFGFANFGLEETPELIDIYHLSSYVAPEQKESLNSDSRVLKVYNASWELKGLPLIKNYLGDVVMSVNVYELSVLPADESLFDTKIFNREILRGIEFDYSGEFHNGYCEDQYDFTAHHWPNYLAPLNWQRVARGETDWLYFEVQPIRDGSESFCWITPIGHRHYIKCSFHVTKSTRNAGNAYRRALRLPTQPYTDLMHQIMDSLRLQLSPEALKQKSEVTNTTAAHPIMGPTTKQIKDAKHAMYMWSGSEYQDKNNTTDDHRAPPEDVAAYIDQRMKPAPLPGAYSNNPPLEHT
jgi:hypothetical protein